MSYTENPQTEIWCKNALKQEFRAMKVLRQEFDVPKTLSHECHVMDDRRNVM